MENMWERRFNKHVGRLHPCFLYKIREASRNKFRESRSSGEERSGRKKKPKRRCWKKANKNEREQSRRIENRIIWMRSNRQE